MTKAVWCPFSCELWAGRQKPKNQPSAGQNGTGKVAGQRGEKVLSKEELGATEERDIAPEGRHFFKILGRRLIVKRAFEI